MGSGECSLDFLPQAPQYFWNPPMRFVSSQRLFSLVSICPMFRACMPAIERSSQYFPSPARFKKKIQLSRALVHCCTRMQWPFTLLPGKFKVKIKDNCQGREPEVSSGARWYTMHGGHVPRGMESQDLHYSRPLCLVDPAHSGASSFQFWKGLVKSVQGGPSNACA